MKNSFRRRRLLGASLMEMTLYLGIAAALSGVTYGFLRSTTMLYAKNASIVRSHTSLRSVLDRLSNNLQQANSLPVLITTTGASSAAPSSGLYYDRYLGDPYVVSNPSGTGLPSSTVTVTLTRSTDANASPPIPAAGDAVLIDDPNGAVRALVSTVTAGAINGVTKQQPITITLTAALGEDDQLVPAGDPHGQARASGSVHRGAGGRPLGVPVLPQFRADARADQSRQLPGALEPIQHDAR